jgi:uncharacterized protein YndB with AHSA1/START domain
MEIIERRIELPAPPEEVWPALTEASRLSAWFGADIAMEPRPGGRATFRWPDGRERGAVVEDVEPVRRLAFRWMPVERSTDGRTTVVGGGRVEFELERLGRGTVLWVREWGSKAPPVAEAVRPA